MKKVLLYITILITLLAPVALSGSAVALDLNAPLKEACDQAQNGTPDSCKNATVPAGSKNPVSETIVKASRVIAIITAVAAVIVIIVSGFRYVTSSGDPNGVNAAKNAILYAVIGLVVALLAPFIIGFVVGKF